MRTYNTHGLTGRILRGWREVGRIFAERLPKRGLYYRDPRISDTRQRARPPDGKRPVSGSWPAAQIAVISSITCSSEPHLWALILGARCPWELDRVGERRRCVCPSCAGARAAEWNASGRGRVGVCEARQRSGPRCSA